MGKILTAALLSVAGAATAATGGLLTQPQAQAGLIVIAKAARQAEKAAAKAEKIAARAAAKDEKQAAREARKAARAARLAAKVADPLPPLDLSAMRLWNWKAAWHASEWDSANGILPWRYAQVAQQANRDTVLTMTNSVAPQLQAVDGTQAQNEGLWESDVTLPQLREGVVVSPLWLYDSGSKDEIDFEFAGKKGLDLSMHVPTATGARSMTVRLFAGQDFSGRRVRFGIEVDPEAGVVNMYVDRKLVHTFDKAKMPFFVSRPLKPWFEMWAVRNSNAGFVSWAGRWNGMAPGEQMTMTVHGYRYADLK